MDMCAIGLFLDKKWKRTKTVRKQQKIILTEFTHNMVRYG